MSPDLDDIQLHRQAAQGHSTHAMIRIIVSLAQLHLCLMAVSIPVMICLPTGCLSSEGYVRTISDGLRDNSVFATTLWGSGMTWISSTRYIGVLGSSSTYAWIAHVSIVVSTYASFLTIRYDMFEIHHVSSAVVWIISSFVFHFSTTVQGIANHSHIASWILVISTVLGIIFVTLFLCVEFEQGSPHVIMSLEFLSAVSIIEIGTVLSIIALDFLQSLHVLNEYEVYWYAHAGALVL